MHHRRWSERVDRVGFAVGWTLVVIGGPAGILLLLTAIENQQIPLIVALFAGIGAGILGALPGSVVILLWMRWRDL